MRATLTFVGTLVIAIQASSVDGALVAYWHFNTYNGDDHSITSDLGADAGATMTIDALWLNGDLSAQTGHSGNLIGATPVGDGIQFMDAENNGRGFTLEADLSTFANPVLSFDYKRTGNGFNNVDLYYSTDNITFTKFVDVDNVDASYTTHSYDFSAINALDGASTAYFRFVLDGASNASGTADFDNIQLNAVPEPSSLAMLGLGGMALFGANRRRLRKSRV
ncbi:MAG: PEP-CTERM sorting domain-containing protein [Planctomycetaceae bacterium]|nr:PEP-CTERM sorting domain-containing protein [Planctomycetaceae bacterium]